MVFNYNIKMKTYNINTIMKYIILFVLLTGCVSKFDSTEYGKLVDIAMDTIDSNTACQKIANSKLTFLNDLLSKAQYAEVWIGGKPDSTEIHDITIKLVDEISRFKSISDKGSISSVYCQEKIKNIHEISRLAIKAQGSEPS